MFHLIPLYRAIEQFTAELEAEHTKVAEGKLIILLKICIDPKPEPVSIKPKIAKIEQIVRSTIAPIKMAATTKSAYTQTEVRTEKVRIDDTEAIVCYDTPITDYL